MSHYLFCALIRLWNCVPSENVAVEKCTHHSTPLLYQHKYWTIRSFGIQSKSKVFVCFIQIYLISLVVSAEKNLCWVCLVVKSVHYFQFQYRWNIWHNLWTLFCPGSPLLGHWCLWGTGSPPRRPHSGWPNARDHCTCHDSPFSHSSGHNSRCSPGPGRTSGAWVSNKSLVSTSHQKSEWENAK